MKIKSMRHEMKEDLLKPGIYDGVEPDKWVVVITGHGSLTREFTAKKANDRATQNKAAKYANEMARVRRAAFVQGGNKSVIVLVERKFTMPPKVISRWTNGLPS